MKTPIPLHTLKGMLNYRIDLANSIADVLISEVDPRNLQIHIKHRFTLKWCNKLLKSLDSDSDINLSFISILKGMQDMLVTFPNYHDTCPIIEAVDRSERSVVSKLYLVFEDFIIEG